MSRFDLPKLPYEYTALSPYIDTETMTIHHTKHHNVYKTNLNNVLDGAHGAAIKGMSLEAIQRNVCSVPDAIKTPVINAGGGHYNHAMFWTIMAPPGSCNSSPMGELKTKIEADFGSVDEMKAAFNAAAAARFGSGWAWLSVGDDGKLFVSSTANQENPLMAGHVAQVGNPILGLDYLKYQNKRPEYISAFWNVVNWDNVAVNYGAACTGKGPIFDVPLV